MRPIDQLSAAEARRLSAIFTDIDGTITDAQGRIPAEVFSIIERAREAGLTTVPITGRPAGWCDMIARTWPIDGVVGENGGLYFRRHAGGMTRVYTQPDNVRQANRARLGGIADEVLAAVPGCALASDQQYREFDLAVDFCEDVPPLGDDAIDRIVALLKGHGMHVKVSNIHVNAWFGDFDKASMCRRYFDEVWGWDLDGADGERAVFFGDSPNDAPLFDVFATSVGVANVRAMADRMTVLPTYVTEGDGADGFVESVERILALR
ncbi:MAG: HAD-IIB family hydrolase [Proteobacteria bacterium]|nr:HAD-IIB family hydrolase [Pseudomonadota bacterium]